MKTITPTIPQLRMLASLNGQQWLIMERAVPDFAMAALDVSEKASEGMTISLEDFFELRPETKIDADGIASVHVHGVLMDSCPPIYEKLGLVTCYSTIMREIGEAIEDGARGVLLITDSPGGTVAGNIECAEFVAGLEVPCVSYAKGLACSAAYKIVSGTRQVIASPSATVGNIGTILTWADCSGFWADLGVEWKAITSEGADLKSTFHLEPDESQTAFLQQEINEMGRQFRDHVAAGRAAAGAEIDPEIWRAGWYRGETAGRLGLIDGIGSESDAKEVLRGLIDTAAGV